jgi:signal transduction histidine kinase
VSELASASAVRSWTYRLAPTTRPRYALGVVALWAAYYGAAKLSYALEFAGPVASIVWLPAGVGIAFLYLAGLRFWPGVLLGDLFANDYSAIPDAAAAAQTLGNLLEVVGAAWLLSRLVSGSPLDTVRGVNRLLLALAAGTAVSATIGPLALFSAGVVAGSELTDVMRTWWLGDAAGAIVVVPFAIAWYRPLAARWRRGRPLEGALLIVAAVTVSELALLSSTPMVYLIFPVLTWAAFRFAQRGATVVVVIAAGSTVWNTVHEHGPFVFHSITTSVLSAQLFIAVVALSALFLGAVVSERQRAAAELAASRARLVGAADTERRRLQRDLHDGAQQRLTALIIHLGLAAEQEEEETAAVLRHAEGEVQAAIDELRDFSHGIDPVRGVGLAAAVRSIAARSAVPVTLDALPTPRLEEAAGVAAFYVVAEAVANAEKHAHAQSIGISVAEAHGMLRVEVADDGIGGADEAAGSGLQGLRDRVEAVRGTFEVDSTRGAGTRITASIPLVPA